VDTFETIRPYQNNEVKDVLKKYIDHPIFQKLVNHVYPTWEPGVLPRKLKNTTSISEFQTLFIYPAIKAAIDRSMDHFTVSGFENISRDQNYLFISNHRDIVLDSCLLFYVLYQNEFITGETAIGDNLLSSDLVTDIVKLNQNFIVHRNLPAREMITKTRELSSYIKNVIKEKKQSIWISHREGRTKDGNDKTHPGVLKMLSMDCSEDKIDYLLHLNIVPISISYEFDSCDSLKANELAEIEINGIYEKDGTEDMKSIITGITQQKGRVHLAFGSPIKREDLTFDSNKIQDHFKELAAHIDHQIHQNFKLFPGNFIAFDILHDEEIYGDKYNAWEKGRFVDHINGILDPRKDKEDYKVYKRILLNIYANPVINQYK